MEKLSIEQLTKAMTLNKQEMPKNMSSLLQMDSSDSLSATPQQPHLQQSPPQIQQLPPQIQQQIQQSPQQIQQLQQPAPQIQQLQQPPQQLQQPAQPQRKKVRFNNQNGPQNQVVPQNQIIVAQNNPDFFKISNYSIPKSTLYFTIILAAIAFGLYSITNDKDEKNNKNDKKN